MLMIRAWNARDERGRQDLHVAREHDEIDPRSLEQLELALLLRRPWCPAVTGKWWNGTSKCAATGSSVGVVADDHARSRTASSPARWRSSRS